MRRQVVEAVRRPDRTHSSVPPDLAERLGLDLRSRWDDTLSYGPVRFVVAGADTADEATVADGPVVIGGCVLAKLGPSNGRRVGGV